MFGEKRIEASMNLPVGSHIDRLAELINTMRCEADDM
jgi:hypothetical protein